MRVPHACSVGGMGCVYVLYVRDSVARPEGARQRRKVNRKTEGFPYYYLFATSRTLVLEGTVLSYFVRTK